MNDYGGFGAGQSVWPAGKPMLFVVPVPAFNQPVRIRSVELRAVFGSAPFAPPTAAYLLQYLDQDYYGGPEPTTEAGLDAYTSTALHTPLRERLDAVKVQKTDKRRFIVIPLNSDLPGCHDAQVVLHVSTSDGSTHTFTTRWFVGLDTGISRDNGDNMCAGPSRPAPSPSSTH
jgi:hypothetical protein